MRIKFNRNFFSRIMKFEKNNNLKMKTNKINNN